MIRPSPTGFLHEMGGPFHTGLEKANLLPIRNVMAYGAKGDGRTDDTPPIQAAMTAGGLVLFPHGRTFIINNPLVPVSDSYLYGPGATIKAGSSRAGALSTKDHHVTISSVSGVTIDGLTFGLGSAYGGSDAERATIHVLSSDYNVIKNCVFETATGIMVKGTASTDNLIQNNRLTGGGGISYSYAGASRTSAVGNYVIDADSNAMSGTGNGGGSVFNEDCLVADNVIVNAGRMGIEDFSQCRRTIIRNNIIDTAANFGISAVGTGHDSIVEGNTVVDFTSLGIEMAGKRCFDNHISRTDDAGIGIQVDSVSDVVVRGNHISGTEKGVRLVNTPTNVTIANNVIEETDDFGIEALDCEYLLIEGNDIIRDAANDDDATTAWHGIAIAAPGPVTIRNNRIVMGISSPTAGFVYRAIRVNGGAGDWTGSRIEENWLVSQSAAAFGVGIFLNAGATAANGLNVNKNDFVNLASVCSASGSTIRARANINTGSTDVSTPSQFYSVYEDFVAVSKWETGA